MSRAVLGCVVLLAACDPMVEPSSGATSIRIDDAPDADPLGFATYGSWDTNRLTWRVDSWPDALSEAEATGAIERALGQWSLATGLIFERNEEADLVFGMKPPGWHGDACSFSSSTIAHAFFPSGDPLCPLGQVHFNSDYEFTTEWRWASGGAVDYETIVLHELGHALGLGHSGHPRAVMWPSYVGSRRDLHEDDVAGARALYGEEALGDGAWAGLPFWEERCVTDGELAAACLATTGMEGEVVTFVITEHDEEPGGAERTLKAAIADYDWDEAEQRHVTCVVWRAEWEPDGPGHPEFTVKAWVRGKERAMAASEWDWLQVGKSAPPPGCQ